MSSESVLNSEVFRAMTVQEVEAALQAFRVYEKSFQKDEIIMHAGSTTGEMGIILSGSVTIENDDIWGNRTILHLAEADDFFAETYAILGDEPLMINVRANEDCRILFMRIGEKPMENLSPWRMKFVRNLLMITSRRNLMLSSRSFHTSPKTIRGRIMAYLDTMSHRRHSREFDIPFDRQQMADYLNVERTALSKELGKMKHDGLIEFRHNHFKILEA